MKILCKSTDQSNKIAPGQQVKRVAKYLYKNLDGAFKIDHKANMSDVYVTLLYQLPYLQRIPGKGKEYNDVHEMTLDINITTYQNKIRIYIIELTPEEKTLGYDLYTEEQLMHPGEAVRLIHNRLVKKVSKHYEDYDFIF